MPENNLEIVDKKNISQLIKELQYLDDEILSKATELKPELSLILFKLEKLQPDLDKSGRLLFDALKEMVASRQEENAILKRLENLQLVFENISSSFHSQENGNRRLQEQQNRVVEYMENWDTAMVELRIKHEISQLSNKTIREVKSSLANEFNNQKIKWIYLLAGGSLLFVSGIALTLFFKKILA